MGRTKRITLAAAGLIALGLTVGADERSLRFTAIDFPGSVATTAFGINERGEVVGSYTDSSNKTHGFVRIGELFRSVDFPGAAFTQARGISPAGEIVGSYRLPGEPTVNAHGYLLTRGGEFRRVDFPGHTNTIAQRIEPDGTILGCYHDTDMMGTMHGIVIQGDHFTEFDMPASMHNGATPSGRTIVGLYTDMSTGRGRAYLINDGDFVPFDVPGSTSTAGWDINPSRRAVGVYQDAAALSHGFMVDRHWDFETINYPGATQTRAFGINAHGDVVGNYVDAARLTHGFLVSAIDGDDHEADECRQ
jgi:uncharacterized membrane protein